MPATRLFLIATVLVLPTVGAARADSACAENFHPFTFSELQQLALDPLSPVLQSKLDAVLSTPVVCNQFPRPPAVMPAPGGVLRIAEWNIRHGLNEAQVEAALSGDSKLLNRPASANRADRRLHGELRELSQADVIALDEVDFGVKRTGYRNVARDLARKLHMNYAYAVEFVELNRIYLGLERLDAPDLPREQSAGERFGVDPKRYTGLEGGVLLSRYPIASAEVIRLPDKYDWYGSEVKAISDLEKARRWSAQQLFQERIQRQVRRGGRIALIVNLRVAQSPTGLLTVVCPHLEDYSSPGGRRKQMDFLLERLASIRNPVVLAGDLNTMGHNDTPVTLKREILNRVTNYRFWARQAFFLATPVPGLRYMLWPLNYFRTYHNPTVMDIPVLLPNREAGIFHRLGKFRFDDGGAFDCGGRGVRSEFRGGTLGASNQRAWKGFQTTFSLPRTWHGLIGRYKLDWILVKPAGGAFTPFDPRTLNAVNGRQPNSISDHAPVTVRLRLPATAANAGQALPASGSGVR